MHDISRGMLVCCCCSLISHPLKTPDTLSTSLPQGKLTSENYIIAAVLLALGHVSIASLYQSIAEIQKMKMLHGHGAPFSMTHIFFCNV